MSQGCPQHCLPGECRKLHGPTEKSRGCWCYTFWRGTIQPHKQIEQLKRRNLYILCYEAGWDGKQESAIPLLCCEHPAAGGERRCFCLPPTLPAWTLLLCSLAHETHFLRMWPCVLNYLERIRPSEVQHLINSAPRQGSEWPFNLFCSCPANVCRAARGGRDKHER